MILIKEYTLSEMFSDNLSPKVYTIGAAHFRVRFSGKRIYLFKNNPACSACGLIGTRVFLCKSYALAAPKLELFGFENGELIPMTFDHIIHRSKGGTNDLRNLRTMCEICNKIRYNTDLSLNWVNILKNLYSSNPERLDKKHLLKWIGKIRVSLLEYVGRIGIPVSLIS